MVIAALQSMTGKHASSGSDDGSDRTSRRKELAVLLDVRLGEDDGFAVARALARSCPGAAVLLISNDDYCHRTARWRRAARGGSCSSRSSPSPTWRHAGDATASSLFEISVAGARLDPLAVELVEAALLAQRLARLREVVRERGCQ